MGHRFNLVRSISALAFGLALASIPSLAGPDVGARADAAKPTPAEDGVDAEFGRLPLYFVEGAPGGADYSVLGRDTRIAFRPGGLTIALADAPAGADRTAPLGSDTALGSDVDTDVETGVDADKPHPDAPHATGVLNALNPASLFDPPAAGAAGESLTTALTGDLANGPAGDGASGAGEHLVALDFVGADPAVRPAGIDAAPGVYSHFRGRPDEWRTGLPLYRGLAYRNLWPGIDLVYAGTADRIKYTFVVHPGADPSRIELAYHGADAVRVNAAGELEIATPAGTFHDDKPYVYQDVDGRRVEVPSAYAVAGDSYGFDIGAYDPTRTLVVDPAVLLYAGFIGSRGYERGLGIAVDKRGSAYIVGQTGSYAGTDVFIAKLSPDGTEVEYLASYGGDRGDAAFDVAVDAKGYAYMIGGTASDEGSFPAFVGPDLTYSWGNKTADGFVAKVNPTGTALVYSGYIGGTGNDFMEGVAIDARGYAYVTGVAQSTPEQDFPVRVGPDLTHNGGYDAFVAKIKPVPSSADVAENFAYIGYIGGAGDDIGVMDDGSLTSGHIALDDAGNAYLSGMTTSDEATFPDGDGFGDLVGPDRTHNGEYDAFVAKIRADGTGLVYAGYIGGDDHELGFGMAVDREGHAHLSGHVYSSEKTFPVKGGPDLTFNGGLVDAFVAKVEPDGSGLVYAGYIGGELQDQGLGVALDSAGHVYVFGRVESDEQSFPTAGGVLDGTHNSPENGADAFVARLVMDPTSPVVHENYAFIGYVGGDDEDAAYWMAVDGDDDLYLVGDTNSSEATFPDGQGLGEAPSFAPYYAGEQDAFVVKIDNPDDDFVVVTAVAPTPEPTEEPTQAPTAVPSATPTTPPPPTATVAPPAPTAAVAPVRVYLPYATNNGADFGRDG